MDKITKKLKITGYVQGVGFRYSMVSEAMREGVTGWVKNCHDGSVEAVVQGPEDAVNKMIEWIKEGPDFCKVDKVDVRNASGEFEHFEIRY